MGTRDPCAPWSASLTSLTLCSSGWSQSLFTSQWLSRKVRVVPWATSAPRIRERTRPERGQKAKWVTAGPQRNHLAFSPYIDTPKTCTHITPTLPPPTSPGPASCTDPPCRWSLRRHFTLGSLMSSSQSPAAKTTGPVR